MFFEVSPLKPSLTGLPGSLVLGTEVEYGTAKFPKDEKIAVVI